MRAWRLLSWPVQLSQLEPLEACKKGGNRGHGNAPHDRVHDVGLGGEGMRKANVGQLGRVVSGQQDVGALQARKHTSPGERWMQACQAAVSLAASVCKAKQT